MNVLCAGVECKLHLWSFQVWLCMRKGQQIWLLSGQIAQMHYSFVKILCFPFRCVLLKPLHEIDHFLANAGSCCLQMKICCLHWQPNCICVGALVHVCVCLFKILTLFWLCVRIQPKKKGCEWVIGKSKFMLKYYTKLLFSPFILYILL